MKQFQTNYNRKHRTLQAYMKKYMKMIIYNKVKAKNQIIILLKFKIINN